MHSQIIHYMSVIFVRFLRLFSSTNSWSFMNRVQQANCCSRETSHFAKNRNFNRPFIRRGPLHENVEILKNYDYYATLLWLVVCWTWTCIVNCISRGLCIVLIFSVMEVHSLVALYFMRTNARRRFVQY